MKNGVDYTVFFSYEMVRDDFHEKYASFPHVLCHIRKCGDNTKINER